MNRYMSVLPLKPKQTYPKRQQSRTMSISWSIQQVIAAEQTVLYFCSAIVLD
jgi:hypothetical protein